MAEQPRDFNHWVKSVERRLQQSLRNGQSPQAVRLAREVQQVRNEIDNIEAGSSPAPAAPIELVVQTRILPDLTGTNQGEVSVDFPDVVRDVDANPIEVDRYELWVDDLKEVEEPEEDPDDESWRTNLVSDTSVEHWRSRATPESKMVADLEEGTHFVAGDRLRFTVTMDMFGRFPHEDDELFHSVRLAAYQGDVEDPTWLVRKLPRGMEGDNSAPQKEEFTVEGEVPEGTTRVTAHFGGTVLSGHIEFNSPTLFNMAEEAPVSPSAQRWKLVSTAVESTVAYSPLMVGADYDVRVRAVAAGVPGPFSVTKRVTVEPDRTPPPIPSALALTSSGATVTASWDLLAGTGNPMPGDFSNTEVAYGYNPAPTEVVGSITNLFSQAIFETPQPGTDVDFDGTYYFRHRSVDTSGNRSGWSESSSIVPKQLVDTAALQFEIDAFNRERIDPLESSINEAVGEAQDAIQSFQQEWDENWDPEAMGELRDRQDTLESDLSTGLSEANQAISSFRTEWDENWDPDAISGLVERANATDAQVAAAQSEAEQAKRDAATAQANAEALEGRADATDAEVAQAKAEAEQAKRDAAAAQAKADAVEAQAGSLNTRIQEGLANAEQSYRSLAVTGPRNIVTDMSFETLDNGDGNDRWGNYTGGWETLSASWSDWPMARISSEAASEDGIYALHYGGSDPSTASLPCEPGETFKLRFQIIQYVGFSNSDDYRAQFRWADANGNGIDWSTFHFGGVGYGNQSWAEFEATAPEGAAWFYFRFAKYGVASASRGVGSPSIRSMTTGDLTVDGTMLARHVDMEDFTADAGFIDNAFVNLIQGKMANFDEALIGGNLLKDRSITTRHLTIADTTDFAPDPIDYAAAWDFVRARVTANTSSFEGAAIALDNTSTSDSGARGPILPVHPGDEIYVGSQIGYQGGAPTSGRVYFRMEWFEDATSSRETFTNVVSTTEASGWFEGTTTVPDYATHARFYIYAAATSGNPGTRRIRSSKVRVKTGGELIVDGSIKARHGDFADITASDAFLDSAMVNLIQGRMANFDEAIIGGNLLKNSSVSAKHMIVTNTQDLWNDVWWEDLLDTAYIFSPNGGAGSSAFHSRFHSENPGGLGSSSFDWRYTTLQGDRGIQTWPVNSTINQRAAFRLGPGKGILVRPGEKYTFRARYRDQNGSGFFNIDMALFDVVSGEPVPSADTPRFAASGIVHSGAGEEIWTFEIPDNYPRMHMVPSINSNNNSESGARTVLRPQLFKAADGKLIVDGLLQATTGVLNELFFDTAVGNSIAAGAGRFLTIETGNLASNAVTADKISFGSLNGALITGLQIQTHTNNRGVKITSAGIRAFNSSGTEVFTVSASNGNVSARGGTFTGASFEGGTVQGATVTGGTIQTSTVINSGSGGIRLSTLSGGGGRLDITDSNANRVFRAGNTGLSLRGDITADNVNLAGSLKVGAGGSGEGGLVPSGDRLDIRGRAPELNNMHGETTFMVMTTPYSNAREWFDNFHMGTLKMTRITYPAEAPRGARLPLAIMNVHSAHEAGRGSSGGLTRNRTNAYFNLAIGYTDTITTGTNPSFAVTVLSTWGQTTPGGFLG